MTDAEIRTIVNGFRLIGEHGRPALEELQAAIDSGEIDPGIAAEAQAQLEDLTLPENIPED